MLKNNILTRIYELQGKLAEIVNELDELEKLVNSEENSEEVAEVVEPREIVFEKDSPLYSDFLEGNVYMWTLYEPVVVIRQSMDGKELSRTINEEGEIVDSMGGFYNLTFEDADAYFDFEIAEIEQID